NHARRTLPTKHGLQSTAIVFGYGVPFNSIQLATRPHIWQETPIFGGDETDRLQDYATLVTVALDRVGLTEQVRQANEALERRVAERTRQLEASNGELTAANKELEAFSYSVSHDLRAPLRAIGGFARILLEELATKLEPEWLDYLRDIDTNAVEMGQLIDDLLQLSRFGRQGLALQAVDPAEVARGALERLKPEMAGRAIEVTVADLPRCNADPALLLQVYLNLLGNAIKFTRTCTVAQIEVGSIEADDPVVYFVRDNGAGFDMAYKDKLFDVFQRLHRQAEYEGTGVGLALVQRIVTRHGGRVWGEGEPGAGATFYFTLEGGAAA
ncbi:MAG: sensor histidine kinase, partial [Candidatus Dormibacteria bacterium]